jgi:hypothetical protein
MPPQIVRLVILTLAIVSTYAVARQLFVPKSFGRYGHYRGDALTEIAAREPRYAGEKACDECHSDIRLKLDKYEHKTIACESCHGISNAHAADPDHNDAVKGGDALCLRCHDYDPARPAFLKQIELSKHYSGKGKCVECHISHQPNEVP